MPEKENEKTEKHICSSPSPIEQETWITPAEASLAMDLNLNTVIKRVEKGKITAKISNGMPLLNDGTQNFLIRLEALSQNTQLRYLRTRIPEKQLCSLDLATPRSAFGDVWISQFLNVSDIIRQAENIRREYRTTGKVAQKLRQLAKKNGLSLATLYRICGNPSAAELSTMYLDPVYLQNHLPKTMCLWSADFAYALFLDKENYYSQNDIFNELCKIKGMSCGNCPYLNGDGSDIPKCKKSEGTILTPNNRKTVNRLLFHVPPAMICYARKGVRQWKNDYGHFAIREKPPFVNELWIGDHHVFNLFVRVKLTKYKNDRAFEKEIAVRPVLTAWMDTATGCIVGWVISVLPNSDTIAEAFCRAVALTVGDEFHGLPNGILVDCGKDYKSDLLENIEALHQICDGDNMYLNRRFAGLGILPALGVNNMSHALPYHPQTKPIEQFFGKLEQRWISKLTGWCYSRIEDRPAGFAARLKKQLENKELMTLEDFVRKFQDEILPAYHHQKECDDDFSSEWIPAFSSMSPMERYNILEKPYMVTPDWQTLSILKLHHEIRKIRRSGIQFLNEWYWSDEMSEYIGQFCDVFYHTVERPLVPSSLTIAVNGRFVCEAFPAKRLKYIDTDNVALQEHLDGQRRAERKISKSLTRIKHSAAGVLPEHIDKQQNNERMQLRDECYAPQIEDAAPSPDLADTEDDAKVQKSDRSAIQDMLAFLFGE